MEQVERKVCFGGTQEVWQHSSTTLGVDMRFGVYLPSTTQGKPCPVLYFLSGLTCTEQNFVTKAGAQRYASEYGVVVVAPDTSPRGEGVADDPGYDLGQGAGFYVNATEAPWSSHYRMYDYIVQELPALVQASFPVTDAMSITGHSMGGHGALMIALKNPGRYRSVSAFSPIVAPSQVPWGHKAFGAYLGDDRDAWKQWDATALIPNISGQRINLFIDQGDEDTFLEGQLKPELLKAACDACGHPLTFRMQRGYDHSYYFIATFIGDHIAYHARALAVNT